MAIVASVLSPRVASSLIPGFGFEAIVNIVPDNSYDANGDTTDLSAVFPNEVYGGHPIHAAIDTSVVVLKYRRAAAGAPATGFIQSYVTDTSGADGAMVELSAGAGNEGITEQYWVFFGR
jgi:hypothetical protein